MASTDPQSAKVYAVNRAEILHSPVICPESACENILITRRFSF